jgi:hypothetical protein
MADKTDPKSKAVIDKFFGNAAKGQTSPTNDADVLQNGGEIRVRDARGNLVTVTIPALSPNSELN